MVAFRLSLDSIDALSVSRLSARCFAGSGARAQDPAPGREDRRRRARGAGRLALWCKPAPSHPPRCSWLPIRLMVLGLGRLSVPADGGDGVSHVHARAGGR